MAYGSLRSFLPHLQRACKWLSFILFLLQMICHASVFLPRLTTRCCCRCGTSISLICHRNTHVPQLLAYLLQMWQSLLVSSPYTRARNDIRYSDILPVCSLLLSVIRNPFENQLLAGKFQKRMKKECNKVWFVCYKAVILHPLSREKGDGH